MKIDRVVLRKMVMPLKNPFQTSFGTITDHSFLIVEVHSEGQTGYAEVTTELAPLYNEETVGTSLHVIEDFLLPMLFQHAERITHPSYVSALFKPIRKNNLAKSGVESAVWDLYAKQQGIPLARLLGGTKEEIDVGVSIGIQKDVASLMHLVGEYVEQGYQRIKIKIKPGWDLDVVKEVRLHYPDISLMADANSAYTLKDIPLFKEMDAYNLLMIEQPLSHDDIVDHSILQKEIQTPICLDESIHDVEDVRKALYLGSCGIINIKIGRVGGLYEAKRIHDFCLEQRIPVWCGGMLESGVGRAHNIAITSLDNFSIPGDTSSYKRYWEEDIVEPAIDITTSGTIAISDQPGIGYEVNEKLLNKYTQYFKTYKK